MKKLPNKFRYMSQTYRIETASCKDMDDGTGKCDVWGKVTFEKSLINVIKDATNDCQLKVLLHEMLHVIFTHSGIKIENEEEVIEAVEHGLIEAMRQNKWMKEIFNED